MTTKSVICCLGGPGSGKGTQTTWLAEQYGVGRVVAGDILREEAQKDTERGRKIAWFMQQQKMVDPALLLETMVDKINASASEFVIIDGFPRSVTQLDAQLATIGKPAAVLVLDVPDEELITRLRGRGATSGRDDDDPDFIPRRIAANKREAVPTVERIAELGIPLEKIPGTGSVEDVREKFVAALKRYWKLP